MNIRTSLPLQGSLSTRLQQVALNTTRLGQYWSIATTSQSPAAGYPSGRESDDCLWYQRHCAVQPWDYSYQGRKMLTTPWKFNSSPLKFYHPKRKVVLKPSLFRGKLLNLWGGSQKDLFIAQEVRWITQLLIGCFTILANPYERNFCCKFAYSNKTTLLPSLKLTARTRKWMVGILVSRFLFGMAYSQMRTVRFREGNHRPMVETTGSG